MKKIILAIIALVTVLTLGNCAFWQKYATPENIEIAAYTATNDVFKHVDPEKLGEYKNQAWAAAIAIRQFEGNVVPTGEELEAAILRFTNGDEVWKEISGKIRIFWDIARSHFGSGVTEGFTALEAGARGVERAARPGPR